MVAELIEAWRTNHRINILLIERISAKGLKTTLSTHGGRDIALQFAHLHNVRVWQLQKRAPDLATDLQPFKGKISPTKAQLKNAHKASSRAIEAFFKDLSEGRPRRRGFKKGIFTTLAYFIAHESHHRGNILLTLKTTGYKLDKATAYAIWDWDRR